MGQREACGRRQREVHPQQLHRGSELGATEPCRSLRKGPCHPPTPRLFVNPVLVPGSWILPFAGLFFLLIISTSMNKGRLVSLRGVGVVLSD